MAERLDQQECRSPDIQDDARIKIHLSSTHENQIITTLRIAILEKIMNHIKTGFSELCLHYFRLICKKKI